MPSSIFSHQAPGLIIKIKYPYKFDGTALCISTLVPDIDVILELLFPISLRGITHSFLGLLIWTMPLTILLTMLFSRYIGPLSANIAKINIKIFKPLRYFGVDEWDHLRKKEFNIKFFIIASYSAIIGGLTHLLLDFPSHEKIYLFFPWAILQSPDFLLYSIISHGTFYFGQFQIEANLTVYRLIWSIESLITFILTLYFLRYIKKHNLINEWYEETRLIDIESKF
ncbi:MAG: DUF4184 family protein [Candidatus Heimdallarchaeota archaeon]